MIPTSHPTSPSPSRPTPDDAPPAAVASAPKTHPPTRGFTADIRPDPYRAPTREQIERARAMYAQGFTVSRILAMTDMALGTLYYWLDGGPRGDDGEPMLPPIPRRKRVVGKRRRPLNTDRVSLAARLWRTAERQVRDIEERLARPAASGPDRERDVRMLTGLIRGLRDLDMLDRAQGSAVAFDRAAEPEDPEAAERRLAELRASVARKLEAIIAERNDEPGAGEGRYPHRQPNRRDGAGWMPGASPGMTPGVSRA